MDRATISQIKNRLSAYLKKVRAGESVLILDRDQPIARLERVSSEDRPDDRLARTSARSDAFGAGAGCGDAREPTTLELVGLDERLNDAAAREGFKVVTGQQQAQRRPSPAWRLRPYGRNCSPREPNRPGCATIR